MGSKNLSGSSAMSFQGTEAFGLLAACPEFHNVTTESERHWDRHTVGQREEGPNDVLDFWEIVAITGGKDWQTAIIAGKRPGNTLVMMTCSTLCGNKLRNGCYRNINSCVNWNTTIGDKPTGCSRNLSHSFQISLPLALLLKTFKKPGSVGCVFGVSNLGKR
jgi:hypothetical protein